MKSELAEEVLEGLMEWNPDAFSDRVRKLEALATHKYDEYGNFRPGVKFFESLAAWLHQFTDVAERRIALEFVLDHLVFISDAEMTHLVELVYPDQMRPVLLRRAASATGIESHRVAQIAASPAFLALRRRSLILGASDGARLDRLRRSAPVLSHEQFLQNARPSPEVIRPMTEELARALEKLGLNAPTTFAHVFLVDDFAGSGETMLRWDDKEEKHKGKLIKLSEALGTLSEQGLVEDDVEVTVVLYAAAEQATTNIEKLLAPSGLPPWEVRTVQSLPLWLRVDREDHDMAALSERYYDEVLTDEHKGRAPLGYAACALPLVLTHNAPNNSISLIWADTTEEEESLLGRRALFPRYERHHRDRP